MIKIFCDRCGGEGATTSTMLPDLLEKKYGLQTTLLLNGQTHSDTHICNDCIAALMIAGVEEFSRSPSAVTLRKTRADAEAYHREKNRLENKLTQAEGQLEKNKARAAQIEAEYKADKDRVAEIENENALLKHRVAQLESEATTVNRRHAAALHQAQVDAKYDPQYVKNVAEREARRAGVK